MTNPVVADNKPVKVFLEKDQGYFFCACGLSSNQPYCDGSHKRTSLIPKKFLAEESGDVFLCMCKHSANTPFCNGTHKQFDSSNIGKEGPGIQALAESHAPANRTSDSL